LSSPLRNVAEPGDAAVVEKALAILRERARRDRLSGRVGIVVFLHCHHGDVRSVETLECHTPEKAAVR
jgi:hypothetical protein